MLPAYFSINNEIYIGMGHYYSERFTDFYKFNISNNSWIRIADFDGSGSYHKTVLSEIKSFVIENTAFLDGQMNEDTGKYQFWKYDSNDDKWIELEGFTENRVNNSTYVYNNKAYTNLGTSIWQFDPGNNNWTIAPVFGKLGITPNYSFVINNIPYIGSTSAIYELNKDVF
jgi:hypothetical protein